MGWAVRQKRASRFSDGQYWRFPANNGGPGAAAYTAGPHLTACNGNPGPFGQYCLYEKREGSKSTWTSIGKACKYMTDYTNLPSKIRSLDILPVSHIAGDSSLMSCCLTDAETGCLHKTDAEWSSVGFQIYRPTNFIMLLDLPLFSR